MHVLFRIPWNVHVAMFKIFHKYCYHSFKRTFVIQYFYYFSLLTPLCSLHFPHSAILRSPNLISYNQLFPLLFELSLHTIPYKYIYISLYYLSLPQLRTHTHTHSLSLSLSISHPISLLLKDILSTNQHLPIVL